MPGNRSEPPPAKIPKLRESCDSCLIAKVKCSKARPLCGRCLANGAPCNYSPSSRSGKRNRNSVAVTNGGITKSVNTSNNNNTPPSPRTTSLPPTSAYLTKLMYPLLDEADRSLLDPTHGVIDAATSPLLHDNGGGRVAGVEDGDDTQHEGDIFDPSDLLPTPPFNQGEFMDFSSSHPFPDFTTTAPPSPRLSNGTLIPTSPSWTTKENPYHRLPSFQSPLDMMPVSHGSSSNTMPRPPALPQDHNDRPALPSQNQNDREALRGNNSQQCDCFAACLQVLQSLHNHSWLLSSTQQGGPPFDIVLTINREAMDSCSTMLQCTKCVSRSGRSISTMMLATIFGKVMSLYRAACFLRFGSSASMQATAQLAFGAYTVTGENRQLLEIEILLLELRKVESILAIYSERFRNAQADKNDETGVYDALTTYLDKNLHYIVDYLKHRKGGASDN